MKKEWFLLIVFCALAFVLLPSFQEQGDVTEITVRNDRVRAEVDKKLKIYRDIETKRCRQKMFEKAGAIADSMLMARSRSKITDPLTRPPIPNRPERPEVLFPKDSTPLAPLLKE